MTEAEAPCVDVLMPVYNGERYLAQQIESILSQRGVTVRVVVLDDGSTDGSLAIAEEFAARDARIKVLRSDGNSGLIVAIGRLLHEARSDFFALSDQDDIWDDDKLLSSLGQLASTGAALVYSDVRVVDHAGRVVTNSYFSSRRTRKLEGANPIPFVFQNPAIGHTLVGRGDVARKAREIPRDLAFHEAWIVAVATTLGSVRCLDRQLGSYREHNSNVVGPAGSATVASRLHRLFDMSRLDRRCRTRAAALAAVSKIDVDAQSLAREYSRKEWSVGGVVRVGAAIVGLRHSIGIVSAVGEVAAWLLWRVSGKHGAGQWLS